MATFPVLGTIWNPQGKEYPYVNFTQPGGPNTPTFPVQDTGQLVGLFMAGCGHSFNNWLVEAATASNTDQVALIMCPLCRFVQQIIDPFSNLYTNPSYEIIFG